jgi:hypothetical protein
VAVEYATISGPAIWFGKNSIVFCLLAYPRLP